MGYFIMTSCFVTTFETQNNDLSYHDQSLIRLSCGEPIVTIYPMVVLESFDVKLRVAFLFVFSILAIALYWVFNEITVGRQVKRFTFSLFLFLS